MAKDINKGTFAQQLANAPIVRPTEPEAPIQAAPTPEPEAPKPIEWLPGNVYAATFGRPTFELGDRKEYKDEKITGKTNTKMAHFTLPIGAAGSLKATIYRGRTIGQDVNGKYAEDDFVCSFPRGFSGNDVDAEREFKMAVLADYQTWSTKVDLSTTAAIGFSAQPRLVNRVRL